MSPDILTALLVLESVADGTPREGRWTWSNEDDYHLTRQAILDVDTLVTRMTPPRSYALRSAVAHVLTCAAWYRGAVTDGATDDDARIALEAAIDAVPFLCPLKVKS